MYIPRWACAGCTARLRSLPIHSSANATRFASTSSVPPVLSEDASPSTSSSVPSATPTRGHLPFPIHDKSFQSRRRHAKRQSNDPALALFRQVVHKGEPHPASSAPGTPLSEFDIAAQLTQLRKSSLDAATVLQTFKANIWPQIQGRPRQLPKHIYLSVAAVLHRVAQEAGGETTLDVLRMFQDMGVWSVHVRADLAIKSCYEIVAHKDGDGDREQKVTTLINIWKHTSQERRLSQRGASLQFVFPKLEEAFADVDNLHPTSSQRTAPALHTCLSSLFPQFVTTQTFILVPALAASVSILSDEQFMSDATTEAAAPLLNLVGAVLSTKMNRPDSTLMTNVCRWSYKLAPDQAAVVRQYVAGRWPKYQAEIGELGSSAKNGGPTALLRHLHKQLRAAYRTRNSSAAVKVWQTLQADLKNNSNLDQHLRNSDAEFLEYLVFVLCALRLPDVLQETLDLMKRLAIHPTIKTYTAMMHGWKLCKDSDKIDALWQRLVASGTLLDSHIWTERISGLIEFGKPQQAIDALASMMSSWKVTKLDQSPTVKPTIEVVNATVKGLISYDPDAAKGVLAWAAGEGIEPNVRTYNILLSESFKNDKTPEGVVKILADMRASGIEPDGATFTIILESVLSGIQDSSPEEQVAAVDQVFRDIASSGLAANGETYGKMLFAVASLSNGSDAAVEAVLGHMRARGLGITPHMITMLIERTLSRSPRNPQAVKDLLQIYGMTSVDKGDQALWERVVSTLALMGDLEGAMRWWDELASRGRVVDSLACLKDLLTALLQRCSASDDAVEEQNYRATAARVVTTVLKRRKGKEVNERYWKHHFWHVAQENGLVGELPPPASI